MTILDEAVAAKAKPGPRCGVAALLEELDPETRDDLIATMAHHKVQSSAISRALARREIELGAFTISRHRAGQCKCPSLTR